MVRVHARQVVTAEKPPGRKRRSRGGRSRRRRAVPVDSQAAVAGDDAEVPAASEPAVLVVETLPADELPADDLPADAIPHELPPTSTPEPGFASRYVPPVPRPHPTSRRAIFFDVENTSRPAHVAQVMAHLAIDRIARATDLIAVGNWRVVSHETARYLARHGAQLVHSAPSVGVRDWSDLRIAVGAGVWLASARAGDSIEVITDDQAFDAVGDVAASLGVAFRRLSYRALAGVVGEVPVEEPAVEGRSRRRSRGGRRGGGTRRSSGTSMVARAPAANTADEDVERQTAPHDEIIAVVRQLIDATPGRSITLDALSNALKVRGFSRPTGSLRLITRLRRIKEIEVSRAGTIRLVDEAPASGVADAGDDTAYQAVGGADDTPEVPPDDDEGEGGEAPADAAAAEEGTGTEPARTGARRRRRRGGRRRRGRGAGQPAAPPA